MYILESPDNFFLNPSNFFTTKKILHWCFCPHWSRDSVSPVCGIFYHGPDVSCHMVMWPPIRMTEYRVSKCHGHTVMGPRKIFLSWRKILKIKCATILCDLRCDFCTFCCAKFQN